MSATLADKEKEKDLTVSPLTELSETEPVLQNTIEWNDSLLAHARELWHHRELLLLVTQREIKVRYQQTALGVAWAVLQPLSLMIVFSVFFSLFARIPSEGLPVPLFYYSGLLPWTFFATALSFAIPSLIANSHIITKIYFPREVIPLANVLAAFVDFVFAAVIFIGMLAWYRIVPTWNILWFIPLLLIHLIFTVGICLGASAFTVLYRDVRFTVPLIIQIWMFASPILYSTEHIRGRTRLLYMTLNPIAAIIDGYRRCILHGQPPELQYVACAAMVSLVALWLGYKYFKHLERQFADIV
jgi:lipopolysaccharide transport system permease protein